MKKQIYFLCALIIISTTALSEETKIQSKETATYISTSQNLEGNELVEISNEEIIQGTEDNDYNGIKDPEDSILNSGVISGNAIVIGKTSSDDATASAYNLGNGIYSEVINIVITENNGIICGSTVAIGGISSGPATAHAYNSGNGIYGENGVTLDNNSGIISGSVIVTGGKSFSDATASIFADSSGNGIYGNITLDNNSGIISGNAVAIGGTSKADVNISVYVSGNGISEKYKNLEITKNTGIISGGAVVTGGTSKADSYIFGDISNSGNGIYSESWDNLDNGVVIAENSGIISGSAVITEDATSPVTYGQNSSSGNGIYGEKGVILDNNSGIINGSAITTGKIANGSTSGNGIFGGYSDTVIRENSGIISGNGIATGGMANGTAYVYASSFGSGSGNGIFGNYTNVVISKNNGIISGNGIATGGMASGTADVHANGFGYISENGIFGNDITLDNSSGIISGSTVATGGTVVINGVESTDNTAFQYSGNGVHANNLINITNSGLIKGYAYSTTISETSTPDISISSGYAVYGASGTINNYGILAAGYEGTTNDVVGGGVESSEYKDYGLNVFVDIDGKVTNVSLGNEAGNTNNSGYTIINAGTELDSSVNISNLDNTENLIINGIGTAQGALVVNTTGNNAISNSIINGYNTALYVNKGELEATNSIFNGGGATNDVAVISLTEGKLNITGNSVINGDTEVSGGSTLFIDNDVQINGNLTANLVSDTLEENVLSLGSGVTPRPDTVPEGGYYFNQDMDGLKLYHTISGFSNINIGGTVIAYETADITSGDIFLSGGSQFVVRVDGTQTTDKLKDINGDNAVIGHALFNHNGTLTAERPETTNSEDFAGPQLIFKTHGLKNGAVIVMDGTDGGGITDLSSIDNFQMGTYSKFTTAHKTSDGKNIELVYNQFDEIFNKPTNPDEPTNPSEPNESEDPMKNLGAIWNSIDKSNQLHILINGAENNNDELEEVLSLLDQIYANNPYVESVRLSKDNLVAFRKSILDTKMPELQEWITQGHGIYSTYRDFPKNKSYDKGDIIVGDNSISNDYTTNLYTYGLLGTGEYGIAENTSLGFAFGGSHQKANMSKNTKLKGDAIYLGTYGKKKIDNFTFTGGIAYQYGRYDGTRNIENKYQSLENKGKVKTDSFEVYGEAKYTFSDSEGRRLEPKLRLSETYIRQHGVSEDDNALAIDMDKKNYSLFEVSGIVDFIQPINVKSGKLESTLGIGVSRTFGKKENNITGRMKNSTDFNVMGPDLQETKLIMTAGIEYEQENGMFYNTKVEVNVAKHTKEEVNVKVGIGYRF